eukprot:SM000011S19110  [mRNA]  locus=s11:954007:957116:- [translate_table: standard]
MCRDPLEVAGVDALVDKMPLLLAGAAIPTRAGPHAAAAAAPAAAGAGSVLLGSRMDHSFVVLGNGKQRAAPGARGGGSGAAAADGGPAAGVRGAMDGSFVMLPSAAAGPTTYASNASLDAKVTILTRVFEIATQQTEVEHPLCLECTRELCKELEAEVDEVERDIVAYSALLAELETEPSHGMTHADYSREKQKAEEEEQKLLRQLRGMEEQQAEVQAQLAGLSLKSRELDELEERYWHEFNDFKLQLTSHQEERDAMFAKIEVASAQLEALKHVNVLNDVFYIWYKDDFGTISNLRLGKLPHSPVEWDEINAAWGQACLLLFTMAHLCRLTFSYRILPMGSYPRIADSKDTYNLFGPVNIFWSTRYDKAMVFYLACLKEFADFAHARDRAAELPPGQSCFQLPYKIENDEVNGFTIKQSFNREERWTKALKFMLCDLKACLEWLCTAGRGTPSHPTSTEPKA